MIYRVSEKVARQISKLQNKDKKKVERVLQCISQATSLSNIPNTIKVKETDNLYRIKITPYRIFFISLQKELIIQDIVHRNEGTYKHL